MDLSSLPSRFFAALLVTGGLLGAVDVLPLWIEGVRESWELSARAGIVAALYLLAVYTGLRLWQGTRQGRQWAVLIFASQIPVLALPGLSYQWSTGARIGTAVRENGHGGFEAVYLETFGAVSEFGLHTGLTEPALGVNVFALIAFTVLKRSGPSMTSHHFAPRPDSGFQRSTRRS
ncbi:MAG: hypothetical protein R3296_00410 [Oleiphilaceae bacterium]|nr:hypothetical protein [Oleiphilaceae bacterium]